MGYRYYAHRLHRFYNCDAMFTPGLPQLSTLKRNNGPFTVRERSEGCGKAVSPRDPSARSAAGQEGQLLVSAVEEGSA
jgi:hypothetical protein